MKLPDRVYHVIERTYITQRTSRSQAAARKVEREDRLARWFYALDRVQHQTGSCGGYIAGCRYRPCYVVE